jgi:cobalt-zinc-cadmium resistance protein CzcA
MEAKRQQSRQRLQEAHSKLDAAQAGFKTLLGSDSAFTVSPTLTVLTTVGRGIEASPYVDWLRRREDLDEASLSLERRKLLPDFTFNYFLGTNFQANAKYYHGFEAGVALPLFFGAQQAKIKASKLALASTQQLSAYEVDQLKTKQQELVNARQLYKERMVYFNDKGRQLHDELLRTATLSLQAGDIDVQHFTLSLETALQLKLDYLANVLDYTHATLELTYLTQ